MFEQFKHHPLPKPGAGGPRSHVPLGVGGHQTDSWLHDAPASARWNSWRTCCTYMKLLRDECTKRCVVRPGGSKLTCAVSFTTFCCSTTFGRNAPNQKCPSLCVTCVRVRHRLESRVFRVLKPCCRGESWKSKSRMWKEYLKYLPKVCVAILARLFVPFHFLPRLCQQRL